MPHGQLRHAMLRTAAEITYTAVQRILCDELSIASTMFNWSFQMLTALRGLFIEVSYHDG